MLILSDNNLIFLSIEISNYNFALSIPLPGDRVLGFRVSLIRLIFEEVSSQSCLSRVSRPYHLSRDILVLDHLSRDILVLDHLSRDILVLDHLSRDILGLDHLSRDILVLDHLSRDFLVLDHLSRDILVLDHFSRDIL